MLGAIEKMNVVMSARFSETERDEVDAMALEYHGPDVKAIRSGRAWVLRLCFLIVRKLIADGIVQWSPFAVQRLLSNQGGLGLQTALKFPPVSVAVADRKDEQRASGTYGKGTKAARPLLCVSQVTTARESAWLASFQAPSNVRLSFGGVQ